MTCVAALIHDGEVWMGADSAGVGGMSLTVRDDSKVFKNGEFIMGFTSSFRMGQLLNHAFSVPSRTERQTDEHYMCVTFINAVRQCLKDGGFATTKDQQEVGGTFLAGYRGKLWLIDSDFQVGIARDGYDAVGCGADIALGALYATQGQPPRDRLVLALRAAEQRSAGVRGPFRIIHSNNGSEIEVV